MKKRMVSIILAVMMIASMIPLSAITASALGDVTKVCYIDENGIEQTALAFEVTEDTRELTYENGVVWAVTHDVVLPEDAYLAVNSNIKAVNSNITLILCDGATLTLPDVRSDLHGICISKNASLSIYGQAKDSGKLLLPVTENTGVNGDGTLNIYGGIIKPKDTPARYPAFEKAPTLGDRVTAYDIESGEPGELITDAKFIGQHNKSVMTVGGTLLPGEDGIYHITDGVDWAKFSKSVAAGNTFANKTVSLETSALCVGEQIGNWAEDGSQKYFAGTFDGGGNTITFTNTDITGNKGVFAYTVGAEISNLKIGGEIEGDWSLGGVVGCAKDTKITNCKNYAWVTSTGTGNIAYAGGVVGVSEGGNVISCCENYGSITGNKAIGGIIGEARADDEILNCINEGAVSGNLYVGGILGNTPDKDNTITVKNCINYGNITATDGNAGGIAGHMAYSGTLVNCFTSGKVSANGGIVVGWANRNFTCENMYYDNTVSENSGLPALVLGNDFPAGAATPTASEVAGKDDETMLNAMNTKALEHNDWYRWIVKDSRAWLAPCITVSAKTESCTEAGWAQHYKLDNKLYEDKACKTEIPDLTKWSGYIPAHHTFTYTAEGGIITAKCSECGETASMSLVVPDNAIYDGNKKAATLNGEAEFTALTGETVGNILYSRYGYEYTEDIPVNAGKYYVKVSVAGKYITAEFNIEKATPTADDFIFTPPENCVCDGQPKNATVFTENMGIGYFIVEYQRHNGTDWDMIWNDKPTDVGKYRVVIYVNEGENYYSSDMITSDGWVFEITAPPCTHNRTETIHNWNTDHTACTATLHCNDCGNDILTETATKIELIEDTKGTCQAKGTGHYVATFANLGSTETEKNSVDTAFGKHNFENGECTVCHTPEDTTNYFYIKNIGSVTATITWSAPNLQYSIGNKNSFAAFTGSVTLAPGEICYFKGSNGSLAYANIQCGTSGASLAAGGDMGTVLNGTGNVANYAGLALAWAFKELTALTDISKLTLCRENTVLKAGCFKEMFYGCTGLTSVPQNLLPATTLAKQCYQEMFQNCTGLTSVPEKLLPATALATDCYQNMFYGCTGLTTLPEKLLPATTLATECYYNMFYGCTGLTSIPKNLLPATALADSCYESMFYGCTNLKNAPDLPADDLCNHCYSHMFDGCPNLSRIQLGFTEWGDVLNGSTYRFLPNSLSPGVTLTIICPRELDTNIRNEYRIPTDISVRIINDFFTVTFDLQGYAQLEGVEPIEPAFVGEGMTLEAPPVPSSERYVFGGWYREPECITPWDFANDKVYEDTTLYAKCIPASCTLWFYLGDAGDSRIKFRSAHYGELLPAVTPPVREGFVFLGYYEVGKMGGDSVQYYRYDGTSDKIWDKEDSVAYLVAHWAPGTLPPAHEHTFASAWSVSDTHHWHDCICESPDCEGNVTGFGAHSWDGGEKVGDKIRYTCTVCGFSKTVQAPLPDTETEPVSDEVKYTGISLTLDSDIYMNFYMQLSEEALASGTMAFAVGGRTVDGITLRTNGKGVYFACPLTALQLSEDVTASFTYGNITYTQTYSVERYIETILYSKDESGQPFTDEMKLLARKIANYGHYAQTYLAGLHKSIVLGEGGYARTEKFGGDYDVDTAAAKAALSDTFVAPEKAGGIGFYGRSVYLESAIALNFYVTVDSGEMPTAFCEGKDVTVEMYNKNIYIVSIKGITATELGTDFTVTVGKTDDFAGVDFTGSVLDYCAAVIAAHSVGTADDDAVCAMAAFYEYYTAAVAYAGAKEE